MASFADLGLKKELVGILSQLKLVRPTEVQEKVIPLVASGKNTVFTSRTGSGKTLAYALGFISKINNKQGLQVVILVPTRELCIQVGKEIARVADLMGMKIGVLYGGREIAHDYKTLNRKNQIIVGTPGRLVDHINLKKIKAGEVRFLVFDESDNMLDDDFYDSCAYIRSRANKNVQLIMASATISDKVREFIENEIREYDLLHVGAPIPEGIRQEKMYCDKEMKNNVLLETLKQRQFRRAIVFCNTKVKCWTITDFLNENKFRSKYLTSELPQNERENNLNLLKEGKIKVLVSTDIAARGLQITDVDIIINYDVPKRPEFYIHRIGRTGRKDKNGYALTLICPEDDDRFAGIEFDYNIQVPKIDQSKQSS